MSAQPCTQRVRWGLRFGTVTDADHQGVYVAFDDQDEPVLFVERASGRRGPFADELVWL